jgi:hypothetical protein
MEYITIPKIIKRFVQEKSLKLLLYQYHFGTDSRHGCIHDLGSGGRAGPSMSSVQGASFGHLKVVVLVNTYKT